MSKINFQIKAIEDIQVEKIFKMSGDELTQINAKRIFVDEYPGFPCRVSLEDAQVGETIIALTYMHHAVNSPYRSSGPIFIRDEVVTVHLKVNEIPSVLHNCFLSLRAYNSKNMMIDALTTKANNVKENIRQLLSNDNIEYIHIHNANPGCFSCCVERV